MATSAAYRAKIREDGPAVLAGTPEQRRLFSGMPILAPIPAEDGREHRFMVVRPWHFLVDRIRIDVDLWYTFDGASVPGRFVRVAHTLTYPKHCPVVLPAALGHDVLCDLQNDAVGYERAARWFYDALIAMNGKQWKAAIMREAITVPYVGCTRWG